MSDGVWVYKCPGCGMTYDRAEGTGSHTICENKMVLENQKQDPIAMAKYHWEKLRGNKSPIIFAWDHYRCQSCGTVANLTVDHIKPIHKGGGNEDNNLQTLCLTCNIKKGTK